MVLEPDLPVQSTAHGQCKIQGENPKDVACAAARESPLIYNRIVSCLVASGVAAVKDIKIQFECLTMYSIAWKSPLDSASIRKKGIVSEREYSGDSR